MKSLLYPESSTLVIFRKYPKREGGEIIALFPYVPGTNDPYTCSSYMHVGQHGSADDRGVVISTKLATEAEYASLKVELESEPYNYSLRVGKRVPSDSIHVRRMELALQKAGAR